MLVQCVDTDLVSNLEITPGINLKALFSHQILRSIIPSLGENFQSAFPSKLFKSSCMGLSFNQVITFEILNQDFKHYHIIGEKELQVSSQSSVMNNFFQFVNLYYGWLEKVYKDKFHLFSIFKQQMGLISFTVSLHYNLSPFDFSISSDVNRIECPSKVEEKTKNCFEWSNHESYCLLPSRACLHTSYDPVSIWMDEFLESQF